jgi:hypothetical protein
LIKQRPALRVKLDIKFFFGSTENYILLCFSPFLYAHSPIIHRTPNMAGYIFPLNVVHFHETQKVTEAPRFVSRPWAMAFSTKAASVVLLSQSRNKPFGP